MTRVLPWSGLAEEIEHREKRLALYPDHPDAGKARRILAEKKAEAAARGLT